MSLSLSQFAKQLQSFRVSIVDPRGRISSEFQRFLYGVVTQSEEVVETAQTAAETAQTAAETAQTSASTAQTAAATAQATATAAAATSAYFTSNSPHQWFGNGSVPAGDPTKDITITVFDQGDNVVATRVLRGTLATATGTITVSSVSNTGLVTSFTTPAAASSVQSTVTVTFADGSMRRHTVSWAYLDVNVGGEIGY